MRPGVIFSGPSLPRASVEAAGFEWRPPARQGDVAALLSGRPCAIGLVDGVFESVPTVWHDEILDAIARGIPVYGAASIGALRAAELDRFGMVGVGAIYEAYRDGTLEDDDEVALLHAPAELGYRALTVPMVNVRATVASALADGLLGCDAADAFVAACKSVFYKERTPERVAALAESLVDKGQSAFGLVDRKQDDAERLTFAMRSLRSQPAPGSARLRLVSRPPAGPDYHTKGG